MSSMRWVDRTAVDRGSGLPLLSRRQALGRAYVFCKRFLLASLACSVAASDTLSLAFSTSVPASRLASSSPTLSNYAASGVGAVWHCPVLGTARPQFRTSPRLRKLSEKLQGLVCWLYG